MTEGCEGRLGVDADMLTGTNAAGSSVNMVVSSPMYSARRRRLSSSSAMNVRGRLQDPERVGAGRSQSSREGCEPGIDGIDDSGSGSSGSSMSILSVVASSAILSSSERDLVELASEAQAEEGLLSSADAMDATDVKELTEMMDASPRHASTMGEAMAARRASAVFGSVASGPRFFEAAHTASHRPLSWSGPSETVVASELWRETPPNELGVDPSDESSSVDELRVEWLCVHGWNVPPDSQRWRSRSD
jgi:hypothetical protein